MKTWLILTTWRWIIWILSHWLIWTLLSTARSCSNCSLIVINLSRYKSVDITFTFIHHYHYQHLCAIVVTGTASYPFRPAPSRLHLVFWSTTSSSSFELSDITRCPNTPRSFVLQTPRLRLRDDWSRYFFFTIGKTSQRNETFLLRINKITLHKIQATFINS